MDAKELKASFEQVPAEDYKLTAVYLDEALALIVRLSDRIATLERRMLRVGRDTDSRLNGHQTRIEGLEAQTAAQAEALREAQADTHSALEDTKLIFQRLRSLDTEVEERKRMSAALYPRVGNLESEVFGYVQS